MGKPILQGVNNHKADFKTCFTFKTYLVNKLIDKQIVSNLINEDTSSISNKHIVAKAEHLVRSRYRSHLDLSMGYNTLNWKQRLYDSPYDNYN